MAIASIAAPDDTYIGSATDMGPEELKVYRTPAGNTLVTGDRGTVLMFRPDQLAAFRELLYREVDQ